MQWIAFLGEWPHVLESDALPYASNRRNMRQQDQSQAI